MLKIVLVSLLLVAATQGSIQIRFPVGASAPGRWFIGRSDAEFCSSDIPSGWWLWRKKSKFACVLGKLKNTYKFTDSNARKLIAYASDFRAHPHTTGYPTFADSASRKAICKVAYDCSCSIDASIWCKD